MRLLLVILPLLLGFQTLAKSSCHYSLVPGSEAIKWTGYKFTSKAPVSGTFQDFSITTKAKAKSLNELLMGSFAYMSTKTIDAGKIARNKNILKGLFNNLVDGESLRGAIRYVDKKKAHLSVFMGRKIHNVPLQVKQDGELLSLTGSFDLIKMGFNSAFKSLHKICKSHHRGKDGKSKTWSIVDLEISAQVKKECS